jgi:very-short-patch-repair endonuclease
MRKTLSARSPEDNPDAPRPNPKGRAISGSRLDTLHETAREMRRSPTEAQTLLGEALIKAELGKYRFRPYTVLGSAIVDFACLPLKVAVAIDEPGANPELGQRSDRILADGGVKVLRFPASEVLADVDGVTTAIVAELKARWEQRRVKYQDKRPSSSGPNSTRPSSTRASSNRPSADRSRSHSGSRGYER